jgi:hypothetical protein
MKKIYNFVKAKGLLYLGIGYALLVYLWRDESSTESALFWLGLTTTLVIIYNIGIRLKK